MRTRILVPAILTALTGGSFIGQPVLAAELTPKPKRGPGVFFVVPDAKARTKGRDSFTSLTGARDAARELKRAQGGAFKQPVTIYVRGGTYFLPEPFVLQPEDSGTEETPLVFRAYPGEQPVLSGGRPITGWKEITVEGKTLWAAEVPEAREGKWFFRELWVDGARRVRARHPNKGYLKIESVPDKTDSWAKGHTRFIFAAGDLKAWPSVQNAEVMAMTRWVESRLPVTGVDEGQRIVTFGKRSVFELQPGDLYYLEHAFEALDTPGEWYLCRASGRLYYQPLRGERPDKIKAVAPVLAQVVRLEGQPEKGRYVDHVEFRGLTFSHTEWNLPSDPEIAKRLAMVWPAPSSEVGGFAQAAVGVPGAVWAEGARHCVFERCTFTQLGNYALELGRGAQSNRVSICELSDLGAGGIKIGETAIRQTHGEIALDNAVNDCRIRDGGKMFPSAVGVWIGQSPNNRIVHNLIHDFYYTGISMGWTWGYGPALATNNLVDRNIVHHIGVKSDMDGPILSDMGGIYTLGRQPRTRITRNLWHDIAGIKYGGWGIYFDEGSSGILAEHNLVYRTTHGGFHQHYGETNLVRNNVFAFGRDHQVQRSREENHVSFYFTRNIVLFDQGVLLGGTWKNDRFRMEGNLYWDLRLNKTNANQMKIAGGTLEAWRQRGHDTNSAIVNPEFAAPKAGIFRFKKDSPATDAGFGLPDLDRVGPRHPLHIVP